MSEPFLRELNTLYTTMDRAGRTVNGIWFTVYRDRECPVEDYQATLQLLMGSPVVKHQHDQLLAALKRLVDEREHGVTDAAWDDARAAIAHAEGGTSS